MQLQRANQSAEAIKLLMTIAADVPDTPGQFVPYVNAFLLAGDWQTADGLIGQVTDTDLQAQLAALQIDHAVLCGDTEQTHLPASLAPHAQRVLQALTAWEQGNDTAANDAAAALPDHSPWRDWKVLIQGLTAFYDEPDAALSSWRQLDAKRAPATIAAPFRGQIDTEFLTQHPQQPVVTARGQQLYDAPWLTALEHVQEALLQSDITTALRHARKVNTTLPAELREVGNRLSRMLYWQVARLGDEGDIKYFSQTFGAPPDDPSCNRLQALIDEQDNFFLDDAQAAWARYEQDLLRHDMFTPASDRDLARSLLWLHMAEVAEKESPALPGTLALARQKRAGCAIDALQCLRRAVELAPQHLTAHEALIGLLYLMGDQEEIVRAAQALLTHFPEHDKALAIVADDAYRHGHWEEAVALQTRALRIRPHEEMLRSRLHTYELAVARLRAQQGQFDEAREILTSCMQQTDAALLSNLLCRMAAVELKAGQQQKGEQLFEQACEAGDIRLVTVFQMLVESVRMPVDAKWIKKIDREFRRGLKAKVHGPSAVEMIKMLEAFAILGISYDGFEEHRELVLQYLKRSRQVRFSEDEFMALCNSLPKLNDGDLVLDMVRRAIRSYPRQPVFHVAFATYYLELPPEQWPLEEVDDALHTAEYLVQRNPSQRELAAKIDALLMVVHAAMDQDGSGGFFDPYDDDDDDVGGGPAGPDIFNIFDKLVDLFRDAVDDDDDLKDFMPFPPPRRRKTAKKRRR
jgi:tetratricopeptide (TPR) repeat protein